MGGFCRAAIVAISLTFAGCLVDVDYSGSSYECAQSHMCPPGFICDGTHCISGIPDAPTGGSGGAGGSGGSDGGATGCGKATLVADNFDDGVRAPVWDQFYAHGGGLLVETGGQLLITLPLGGGTNTYTGYAASRRVDLTGDRVYVEVPQTVDTTSHAQQYLHVSLGDNDKLTIQQEHGNLVFTRRDAGTLTRLASILWDPTQYRWWQIRESQGTIFYETSPDGIAWSVRAMTTTPSWANLAIIDIGAGTYQTEIGPYLAKFDNLNGGQPPPGARWCPATDLRDDFNDGVQGPLWARAFTMGGATLAEQGGYAVFTPVQGAVCESAYVSATSYDLAGSSLTTYAFQVTRESASATYTFLMAQDESGNQAIIEMTAGNMTAAQKVGGIPSTLASVPYNGATHAWWRLRESGGMIFWETSPDGMTWSMLAMGPSPVTLSPIDVSLGAGVTLGTASPGLARFDSINP